MINTFRYLT